MKPDLNEFPEFTTDKFEEIYNIQTRLQMAAATEGGWYDCEKDIICWFGHMNWNKLLFAVDHEFLHRIIHGFVNLNASRQMDWVYLFDIFGINKYGNPSNKYPDSVFYWRY